MTKELHSLMPDLVLKCIMTFYILPSYIWEMGQSYLVTYKGIFFLIFVPFLWLPVFIHLLSCSLKHANLSQSVTFIFSTRDLWFPFISLSFLYFSLLKICRSKMVMSCYLVVHIGLDCEIACTVCLSDWAAVFRHCMDFFALFWNMQTSIYRLKRHIYFYYFFN